MKKLFLLLALLPGLVFAAGGGHLQHSPNDLGDKESLKNGAKLFTQYCLSCHSAKFMRFTRMADDLGITEEELRRDYMFTTDKPGEVMNVAMTPADATRWFGVAPPDLSVITRARGVDWVYTYLLSFYRDEKRPFGVNNQLFPDVAMPHVLWELQGMQKAVFKTEQSPDGKDIQVIEKLEPENPAKAESYQKSVTDLVNFLEYLGEPAKLVRKDLGYKVIGFLLILLVLSYILKREYWRDVR